MLKLQRSSDRRYVRSTSQEMWMTFDQGNDADPFHGGFRALGLLNEVKLLSGAEYKPPPQGYQESLTYVREGRLILRQRSRRDEVLGPGSYQRANSHRLMTTSVSEQSPSQAAHLFVSSLAPIQDEGESSCERKHSPFSDRHGILRLIASPDGSAASLRLKQDVCMYSSLLDPGHHVVHELRPGRGAWLHIVAGRVRLLGEILLTGDGASVDHEPGIAFTAQADSEILLFDLA